MEECERRQPTHVILANMHALTSDGKSDINPVIDQQGHVVALRDLMKPLGRRDEHARVGRFVAVLHTGDATSQGCLDHIAYIPRPQNGGRRVRDQVE
jgi:hypothetical protein